jgi:penicillin-binding protein 2
LLEQFNTYRANPVTVFPLGDIDPADFAARESELLSACNIRSDTRITRRYVGHGIATHVIGYVGQIPTESLQTYLDQGYESGDLVGLSGLELQYEDELSGQASRVLRIVEPGGLIVRELAGATGAEPHDVTLTLDLDLQRAAAQALSDAYNEAAGNWAAPEHSPGGAVIALDIDTGAVLALASYPTFDPGIFNPDTPLFLVGNYIQSLRTDTRRPFINRVVQEQYPPGSTFKIVTLSAAVEERLFRPNDVFYCPREWRGAEYGDSLPVRYDWRNWEPEERNFDTGEITMPEALAASCNPFFYQMGALLARDRGLTTLGEYARQMGLGRPTGLVIDDRTQEASGQIALVRAVDQGISAAIGQSDMQVTIVQMARMAAAIANGGTLYTPYLVEQVGGEDGSEPIFRAEPEASGDIGLSESTLEVVREGMCMVTTRAALGRTTGKEIGTAWFVFDDAEGTGIAPYTSCGKTGTAQSGRTEPHGWYVGFAPADDPQIAVVAMIEFSREGSETAAPIVRAVLDAYFDAPTAPFPWWWSEEPYTPLPIPEGMTGG